MVKSYNTEQFNTKITSHAFDELLKECKGKKKICRLEYNEFKQQEYLTKMNPGNIATSSRIRAKMQDIADDRPYLYEEGNNTLCLHCKMYKEDLYHVVNCY